MSPQKKPVKTNNLLSALKRKLIYKLGFLYTNYKTIKKELFLKFVLDCIKNNKNALSFFSMHNNKTIRKELFLKLCFKLHQIQ